ncbi:MAG: hypothetical protein OHK0053_24530 [Microscillaceae bacterium]
MLQTDAGILQGLEKVESHLQKGKPTLTLSDAASVTGYHIDDAKKVMEGMMAKYHTRLLVTENGDLIYDFGSYLHRRGERTWAEWWRGAKKTLWKVFVWVFKAWITVTLVVYFTIFLLILIAALVAMMSANKDGDNSKSSGGIGELIGALFRSIFIWDTVTQHQYQSTDSRGYTYRNYQPRPALLGKKTDKPSKNFVASVYDFVFGPPHYEPSPLANQQEVASFLRENRGVITTSEIIGLAGWKVEEAELFMGDCLARFKGEVRLTDEGVLYGDFEEMTRSKLEKGRRKIEWYWDEYEAPYQLTGNSAGRNALIIFMNLFNLSFASFFLYITQAGDADMLPILVGLGYVPFTFSAIFFGLPLYRSFQVSRLNERRRQNNRRKRLMKIIFQFHQRSLNAEERMALEKAGQAPRPEDMAQYRLTAAQLTTLVNLNAKEEKLSLAEVETLMKDLLPNLWGEMDSDLDTMTNYYRFPRLAEEVSKIHKVRQNRLDSGNLGEIVMDTDN